VFAKSCLDDGPNVFVAGSVLLPFQLSAIFAGSGKVGVDILEAEETNQRRAQCL
jgi:hypothetical protein